MEQSRPDEDKTEDHAGDNPALNKVIERNIRTIIRLRKKDPNERMEEESILETYMAALGME